MSERDLPRVYPQLDEHGKPTARALSAMRGRMFKDLREMAVTWSAESLDLARAYYAAPWQRSPQLVEDKVYLPKARCSGPELIKSVAEQWWPSRTQIARAALPQTEEEREAERVYREAYDLPAQGEETALCGFYGRYLSASGFHLVLEFSPDQGLTHVWRIDARAQGVEIKNPQDEDDFYDQMACFLDLRYGWRWQLNKFFNRQRRLTVIEAQHNYVIGIREGEPGSQEDPAEREDGELLDAFSRFDAERFDTLEFLNSDLADQYPFEGERCYDWMPDAYREALRNREVELFVLAVSDDFTRAIEDMCEVRHVELALEGDEEDLLVRLHRGPVSLTRSLSMPYLWTLHSGRTFAEGAVEFFREDAERVRAASELYFGVSRLLARHPNHHLSVSDDAELVIAEGEQIRASLPLLTWGSMGAFEGAEGPMRALTLLGFELSEPNNGKGENVLWHEPQHPLDACPLCASPSLLRRVVRPLNQQPAQAMSASFERPQEGVWGYYTLSCTQHSLPVTWSTKERVEEAMKAQSHQHLEVRAELNAGGVSLLWAEELAGLLLDPQGKEALRERGGLFAHAFTPDVVALSMLPLEGAQLEEARQGAELLAQRVDPTRLWAMSWGVSLK